MAAVFFSSGPVFFFSIFSGDFLQPDGRFYRSFFLGSDPVRSGPVFFFAGDVCSPTVGGRFLFGNFLGVEIARDFLQSDRRFTGVFFWSR
jgi:hypothetical protein